MVNPPEQSAAPTAPLPPQNTVVKGTVLPEPEFCKRCGKIMQVTRILRHYCGKDRYTIQCVLNENHYIRGYDARPAEVKPAESGEEAAPTARKDRSTPLSDADACPFGKKYGP
jgi:ribosomal protein S27AE